MKILVIGGTRAVGSQLVRELLARGRDVQVLTRSADKAKRLPAGAKGVVGDLLDPGTVRSVFKRAIGVSVRPASTLALRATAVRQ